MKRLTGQELTKQTPGGAWVPVIPWATHNLRYKCRCGRSYWTDEGYRSHYALAHILEGEVGGR